MSITTIDCHYTGRPGVAAAYLVREGDEAAFVEANTSRALPHLLAALDATGLSAEAVRYVIVTHAHLDHASGAAALMARCPRATLLAHPRAAPHLIDPAKLVSSAKKVYGEAAFTELYGEVGAVGADRVRVMEDGEALVWGARTLTFLHTRGHANHHFCVQDSTSNGVFTGDAFGIGYPAVQGGGAFVFPSTTPTDFDAEAAIASVRRIVDTGASQVFLTHFGAYGDVAGLGEALVGQLEAWGALVDEADASGLEGAALEGLVGDRIAGWFKIALEERGLADDRQAVDLVDFDRDLNAQGVVFAVQKRRYKRGLARN